jgi:RHH-type proline utilization regulon transcriptional repressor/proline dehydrogenase/delta 1-pyrroline-5-carboxylate dehydrogenase
MPGPTGERNTLYLSGRGIFVCISPWNFPLAIFIGQIAAALMAGNAVIAKPAEQTPLIAMRMAKLILQAGLNPDVFSLLPGDGEVGARIVSHPDVAGVAFTGSTEVARLINRALADKDGPIVPLIAETGGQNAMIVDSSALPEQVVDDVLLSAFGSAGQRCSALRVLYLQEDIADKTIHMLKGAMQELRLGNPMDLSSDVGPVIDEEALSNLIRHREALEGFGRFIAEAPLSDDLRESGHFFAPVCFEIGDIIDLKREVFGPILHVIRYSGKDLLAVVDAINATGYGLTLGVHSRIESTIASVTEAANVGNAYVNRSMIGAVVGVQPFGGSGLSGTGPKAGGPHYLPRFATEKTITINTTASGGNASLVMMEE